jgi:F-type H+-transporting ATPase subunit delta
MVTVIAKKYVRALLEGKSLENVEGYYKDLYILNDAYSLDKMKNIILSPDISKSDKFEFIISLLDNCNNRIRNFINILVQNDRIYLLPAICDEIRYQISVRKNKFIGNIITKEAIDSDSKRNIEEKISKKFNSSISLNNIVSNYPGIKIEIKDLGVEISFSINRLKAQMAEHILKAI